MDENHAERLRLAVEDAMHGIAEAARRLEDEIERRELWQEYIGELACVLLEESEYDIVDGDSYRDYRLAWFAIRAEPRQRARAFLAATSE